MSKYREKNDKKLNPLKNDDYAHTKSVHLSLHMLQIKRRLVFVMGEIFLSDHIATILSQTAFQNLVESVKPK